jgi:WD40 repeat protein
MDQTIRLWNAPGGELLKTLCGESGWVWGVSFSPDGRLLVSSGYDGTIRVWDVRTGECCQILRSERSYEGMNIIGAKGLTENQRVTLKALGATEE